ncbi:unnamed protein product [Closterium sp. NIES-54]
MAALELRCLIYLQTNLGEQPCSPPVLYVDNKAMIALSQEHRLEHRTKHITLRYFLARELQQLGQLRLTYWSREIELKRPPRVPLPSPPSPRPRRARAHARYGRTRARQKAPPRPTTSPPIHVSHRLPVPPFSSPPRSPPYPVASRPLIPSPPVPFPVASRPPFPVASRHLLSPPRCLTPSSC